MVVSTAPPKRSESELRSKQDIMRGLANTPDRVYNLIDILVDKGILDLDDLTKIYQDDV